jgi:ABC-type molybdate transport system substrate-binding protein
MTVQAARAEDVTVFGAGSLREAIGEIASRFDAAPRYHRWKRVRAIGADAGAD